MAHSLRLLIGDEAFFGAVTRLVYGRPDPRPGNFEPLYATTPDFIALVNDEAGRDLGWFFAAYVYQAALPELVMSRDGDRVALEWQTASGPFPMPVEVEIDGRTHVLPMTGGRGEIAVPDGAHVLIDPANKLLRQLDFIDAWQADQAAKE